MRKTNGCRLLAVALVLRTALAVTPTQAHELQGDVTGGLLAGFVHPIAGLDHVVALVTVGLLGAQLGRPAIFLLPITFPIVMALGGVLGAMRVPFPGIETGIAASALVLGAMIALAVRAPLAVTATIVAWFAIFHGYAHGAELPAAANAVSYAFGFVVATGLLHAVGILVGTIRAWRWGAKAVRAAGAAVAFVGVHYLISAWTS